MAKSCLLTDKATGTVFYVLSNKIVKFIASGANDSLVTYLSQNGTVITRLVDEAVATIDGYEAAAFQAVTLVTGETLYINNANIVYIDLATSTRLISLYNFNDVEVIEVSTAAAAINTAAGVTLAVTVQNGSVTRYINSLLVDQLSSESVEELPTLSATYKIKTGVVALTVQGAGYTAATVAFAGGGPGAVLPTATATVAGNAVTQITVNTAGSNITADVTVTINGDGLGATCVDKISHVLDTLTVATPGANLNTAPTATFSAGTVTATATIQIDTDLEEATGTTITQAGEYLASAFPPTITVGGGTGCYCLYDSKKGAFEKLQLETTAASLTTAINAL
jgi:hypothetical protein